MSCEPCCPPFIDDRCSAFERKEFGSVYSASLSAWFPLFWEMQFENVTVEFVWDSGLTWISDSFTYSGETYVATLVISGLDRKDAVVTLTGPAYFDVVYKNKWGFIPLGANRMFADQSASDGDIDGLSACLYPKTVIGECDGCDDDNIAGVVVDGLFGVFVYHPSTVDTIGTGPSCVGSGEGGLHTDFRNPHVFATCRYRRYQCGVNPWPNTWGNGVIWMETVFIGNPDGVSPTDMQIRVDYAEADGSGGIYNTVYEYHFTGENFVPCLDFGEYTLSLVTSNKPGVPSSITVRLTDA